MITSIQRSVTRDSLSATASSTTRWIAGLLAGTSVFSTTILAVDNDWTGAADTNWNNPANWSDPHAFGSPHVPVKGAPHPDDEDARINDINLNFPIVTAATGPLPIPRDVKVGVGGGPGRLDVRGGTVATGGGNWMFVGSGGGGSGTLNIADTSATGGTLTGFGQGTGNTTSERLYVGGQFGSGTGTVNIHTTATVLVANRVYIGNEAASTGTVNMDSGTFQIGNDLALGKGGGTGVLNTSGGSITTGGWNFFGKNEDGTGGTGTVNMSGGTLTNTGRTYFGQVGATGILNLTGGDYLNVNNEQFIFGEGAGGSGTVTINNSASLLQSTGELWFGQAGGTGTLNLSAGEVTVANWVAVGRDGGTGEVNMSGGTITKTGDNSQFIVGASGPGEMTQTGGLVDIQGGYTWVGEQAGATTAVLTINGTADYRSPVISVGPESPDATLNLDGGTVRTHRFTGTRDVNGGVQTGTGTINFNGSQIVATGDDAAFIAQVDNVNIGTGGLRVDSNSFILSASQSLAGGGGVVKSGAGTLNLNGANSYTGATTVSAGTFGGSGSPATAIAVAAGAELNPGVTTGLLSASSINLASATLGIDIVDSGPVAADRLAVANNLNITGTTLDLNGTPTSRVYILASYGSRTGSFATPTLPSGYSLNYTFNGNQIAITRAATSFDNFIDPLFAGNPNDPGFVGPNADPDNDGESNFLEFALGGNPATGSDGPKVYPLVADSNDAGTERELLITIAVRNGTPVFLPTNGGSPTATQDGATYSIQGSTDLVSFTSPVSVVAPVTTGLPAAPAGYTYRTFSLAASNELPGKGFLRVSVTP